MKLLVSITCPEQDAQPIFHIPDYTGSDTTLCGLSDVPYASHNAAETGITCRSCLDIVEWCKKIKLPRKAGRDE